MTLRRRVSISVLPAVLLAIGGVGSAAPVLGNHELRANHELRDNHSPLPRETEIHGACDAPARHVALQDALEYRRSHEPVPWSDRSGHAAGEIIVQRTYEQRGGFCRDYVDRCLVGETEYLTEAKACRVGFERWDIVEVYFTDVNGPFMSKLTTRPESAGVSSAAYQRPAPAPAPLPHPTGPDFDVAEVQRSLVILGYDPGPVDGVVGPKTVAAIGSYARARGVEGTWRSNPDLPAAIVREARSAASETAHAALVGYGDPYRYKKRGEGFHAPLGYVDKPVEPGVYLVSFYGGGGGWEGPSEARTIENMLTRALELCTEQGSDGYELLESPSGELISTGTWRTSLGGGLPVASAYVSCCDGPEDGFCTTSVASAEPHGAGETLPGGTASTAPRRWRSPADPYPIAGR